MDVAKVGVRALDKATESSRQTKRRRKVGGEDLAFSSSSSLTHDDELDNFCKFPQASIIQGDATGAVHENQSSNFTSDINGGASCCSSNGSAEAATHKNPTDLEESVATEALSSSTKYNSTSGSGETLSNQLQSEETFRQEPTSEISCFRRITVQNVMPLEAELEEFFAVAEKNFRKQFTDKYNYDISKDEPLGGRYEWVPLKP